MYDEIDNFRGQVLQFLRYLKTIDDLPIEVYRMAACLDVFIARHDAILAAQLKEDTDE